MRQPRKIVTDALSAPGRRVKLAEGSATRGGRKSARVYPESCKIYTGSRVKLPKGQYVFHVVPCPAPRMTRADVWKKRPCVLRYRAFRDKVRAIAGTQDYKLQAMLKITFTLPMPPSWSAQKRQYHDGQPHQQRPDFDNLLKSWCDVWGIDDGFVWRVQGEKRWGVAGRIDVTEAEEVLYVPNEQEHGKGEPKG